MIRSVVLDQDRSLAAIAARQLLQERQVAGGVENPVLALMEARAPEFDGAQDLHVFAFSGDRNFRGLPDAAPGSMQSRVLAEAGFVGENQRPVARLGFFLRLG
jgi:hypothetical protein